MYRDTFDFTDPDRFYMAIAVLDRKGRVIGWLDGWA